MKQLFATSLLDVLLTVGEKRGSGQDDVNASGEVKGKADGDVRGGRLPVKWEARGRRCSERREAAGEVRGARLPVKWEARGCRWSERREDAGEVRGARPPVKWEARGRRRSKMQSLWERKELRLLTPLLK